MMKMCYFSITYENMHSIASINNIIQHHSLSNYRNNQGSLTRNGQIGQISLHESLQSQLFYNHIDRDIDRMAWSYTRGIHRDQNMWYFKVKKWLFSQKGQILTLIFKKLYASTVLFGIGQHQLVKDFWADLKSQSISCAIMR